MLAHYRRTRSLHILNISSADQYSTYTMYSTADIRAVSVKRIMSSYDLHNYGLGLNGVWCLGEMK